MYPSSHHFVCSLINSSLVVFANVKKSLKFIPFLVYLHPLPTNQLVGVEADYWINLLIACYLEDLREGMPFSPIAYSQHTKYKQ